MESKQATARVFRYDPGGWERPRYQAYEFPLRRGMSAMDVVDYIYHNLDGGLAYFDHAACALGICGRCTGRINGRPGLFCQTLVQGDVTLEPLSLERVIQDLVVSGA